MKDFWEYAELDAVELIEDVKKGKVTIPSFQRGIVWKPEQSKLLIESIKSGFPFGSILIYHDEKGNTQLIDGLQRSITVYGFITKPAEYFDDKDIDEDAVKKIIALSGIRNSLETVKDNIYKVIKDWIIKNHDTMESIQGMQFRDLSDEIVHAFGSLHSKEKEVAQLLQPMMKKYQDVCRSLADTKIPALVYKGNASNLPIIFERINKRGTSLSKYQIYAASWTGYKVQITQPELKQMVSLVASRYDVLGGKGKIKVDNYDSTTFKKDSKLNVFELGYGFGKYLYNKYPQLFGNDNKPDDISSLGFNLINACLIRKSNEMSQLNDNIRTLGTNEDINHFLIQITQVIDFIEPILTPLYSFKGNRRKKDYSVPHGELQIVSIIAQIYKIRFVNYEIDDNNTLINAKHLIDKSNPTWKEDRKQIKKNLGAYYLSDLLNSSWKGTGDKQLNDIIFTKHEHYLNNYNRNQFIKEFELWFEKDSNNRNERDKVASPSSIDKVILNIVYSQEFSAMQHLDDSKYDIEHLCTKNLMKTKLKSRIGLYLPISSLGNICLLPEYNNRSKKDKLIYEDLAYIGKLGISELEEKYTFTTKSDYDWIDEQLSNEDFKKIYFEFLYKRFVVIKDKVVKYLFDN